LSNAMLSNLSGWGQSGYGQAKNNPDSIGVSNVVASLNNSGVHS